MEPFSIRHGKAIQQLRIRVSMKDCLRSRLWMIIQKYNENYSYCPILPIAGNHTQAM